MKSIVFITLVSLALLSQAGSPNSAPASFACVLQADTLAKTKARAVERLAACDRDWIILDVAFDGETMWDRANLDALRRGRSGRKVLAYMSIGEAEDYRAYWRKEWTFQGQLAAAAPVWLGAGNPEWEGNYRVKYWLPEWQALMLAAMDDALARGFDGLYLDIVDAFETYEQNGEEYADNRLNPDTRQSYRRDMVDWVKWIATRARAKNPAALIVPQNGSQLLSHTDFLAAISAIGIEDLFTNGDKLQPKSYTREVLGHLKAMTQAQKPMLLIEYPKSAKRQALSKQLATQNGMIWLITDRQLMTLGESGR